MKLGVAGYGIPDDLADIDSKVLRNLRNDGFSGFSADQRKKWKLWVLKGEKD